MKNQTSLRRQLIDRLERFRVEGRYRSLPHFKAQIDFCSNDYLGLASQSLDENVPLIKMPSGATGSRLVSGNSPFAEELEAQIARFHGASSALLFSSGYLANLSLVSSLTDRHDTILYDQLIHASLRDGIRLSHSRSFSFRHNDVEDLREKLSNAQGSLLVVVESLYSMDGDRARLKDIVEIAHAFGAEVVVDEAHSIGIDGAHGSGLVSELGLEEQVLARTVTFGKAMGCHGAAVVSGSVVRDTLINCARGFIFTTAPSPRTLQDIQNSYELLPLLNDRREKITALSNHLRGILPENVLTDEHSTPIHRIVIPGNQNVLRAAEELRASGFAVIAIRSPTVAPGSERIRICLHSYNTIDEVSSLGRALLDYIPVTASTKVAI